MIYREPNERPVHIYPPDEWRMVEKEFYPRFLAVTETIFSTANGYLGMRGNFEEGSPVSQNGSFVNGFFESWPIVYGEEAYGFAKTGQTIVSVTDSKTIKLYVDDEPLSLTAADLLEFNRTLDMKGGTLDREILWETPAGKRISIKSQRLASFPERHLAAISYEVTVLNAEAPVVISSELETEHTEEGSGEGPHDPRLAKGFTERVLLPQTHYSKDQRIVLSHATKSSRMTLACGIDHRLETKCRSSYATKCSEDHGKVIFSIAALPGVPIKLIKFMTYHTSVDAGSAELCERAERTLDRSLSHGYENVLADQRAYLAEFWRTSDVQLVTDVEHAARSTVVMQQALRFSLFQILQASGRADTVGVGAKGLTGKAYEGHYFWDTEIYVLPFLIYSSPRIARNLLKFRHSYLDKARERARQVNQKGALFPWRTIDGEETSAYYAAGTAQYHINADIMHALKKYVNATGDKEFLYNEGVEMLVETARLWRDIGFYSERRNGQFCIHGVTGPDEYTTVVNNNTFTNLMARENLRYAVESVEALQEEDQALFDSLVHKTGLELSEVKEWRNAAEKMYIPFDEKTGINPQDDQFLEREVWDFEGTPPEKYPLLLHHHPLVIYRYQVIKQADVVLAMFLFGRDFSEEQKKRNFDYYDALTTGDSSLSVCIQSIVASEIGYLDKASEYARYASLMDLEDIAGNVKDGCHIASMGGSWMVSVYGFGGMRDYDGHLSFRPRLPRQLERLRFPLTVRGQELEVDIGQESVTYLLRKGSELGITHCDKDICLTVNEPVTLKIG